MIKMARDVFAVSVLIAAVVLLSGCGGLQIKSTSGIRGYLIMQARCELLAIKIKNHFPDKSSKEYMKAERLFNDAAAVGNGTMAEFIVKVKTSHVVEVTGHDFQNSNIYKKMQAFLTLDEEFFPQVKIQALEEVQAVLSSAKEISGLITVWQDRVDKETEAGLNAIDEEWFNRVYWNGFDKTTPESFNNKWQRVKPPTS